MSNIDLKCLTLSAATKCNLKCSYCVINKTLNDKSLELFNNTVEALKNGEYKKNVLKALDNLEVSPKNIDYLQIWGQEPTIVLPYITEKWEDWYKTFPNINRTFFSTNAMDCVDQLYDFIVAVDKAATKHIQMGFQISYDGYTGTNKARLASADRIKENCLKLNKKLNNLPLKNVNIEFTLHGVLSKDIFNNYTSFEEISKYLDELDNYVSLMRDSCFNRRVEWFEVTLQLVNGIDFTTEDGLNLSNFVKKVNILKERKNYGHFRREENNFAFELIGPMAFDMYRDLKEGKYSSLDEMIDSKLSNKEALKFLVTCLPVFGDLKIMYDGTVTFCQNSIHDTNLDESKLTDSIFDQTRLYQMRHMKVNLANGKKEDIDKFLTFIKNYHEGYVFYTTINTIMNYMILMAQCGQIDRNYLTDLDKLKRHAFYISQLNSCYYNLAGKTGSAIIRNTEDIRIYGNGLLDIFEDGLRELL